MPSIGVKGVPAAGPAGLALAKQSSVDYDADWDTAGDPSTIYNSGSWYDNRAVPFPLKFQGTASTYNGYFSLSIAAGRVQYAPVYIGSAVTVDQLAFSPTSITVGMSWAAGICAADSTNGVNRPGTVLGVGYGTTVAGTSQTITLGQPVAVGPGWYWLAVGGWSTAVPALAFPTIFARSPIPAATAAGVMTALGTSLSTEPVANLMNSSSSIGINAFVPAIWFHIA